MAVSVVTLWLIYVLVILVIAIVLSFPRAKLPNQSLIAVLFASIIGAIVAVFVPVNIPDEASTSLYNTLLVVAFLLPIILTIVIACSGIHHRFAEEHEGKVEGTLKCKEDSKGREKCKLKNLTLDRGDRKVNVSFK